MRVVFAALCVFTGMRLGASNPMESPELAKARSDCEQIRAMVAAGVLPKSRLEEAGEIFADARDEEVLQQSLCGSVTVEQLTADQARDMVAAAGRRLDRQQRRVNKTKTLVDAGALSRMLLTPDLEELDLRRKTVDLAVSRSRLFDQLAAMARAEQSFESTPPGDDAETRPIAERFDGSGTFRSSELVELETKYSARFSRALPISARGETAVHRSMGFDHRGRVDVALNPDQPEGVWLRRYLESRQIPYLAFRCRIPGTATAAHIHIGPPSPRLRAAD